MNNNNNKKNASLNKPRLMYLLIREVKKRVKYILWPSFLFLEYFMYT